MVTKRETIDYPLISASEVEEVLTQTGIQVCRRALRRSHKVVFSLALRI